MSLPTLCRLTFVLAIYGVVAAIRANSSSYLVLCAGIALVALLIGMQLPEDEQPSEQGGGEF